jgi:hypothetical protein
MLNIKEGMTMPIPIVQSGPNKGKERSRNKNGQWRKKRSDAGLLRRSSLSKEILEFLDMIGKKYD